jgi:hypothetical protein
MGHIDTNLRSQAHIEGHSNGTVSLAEKSSLSLILDGMKMQSKKLIQAFWLEPHSGGLFFSDWT